MRNSQQKVIAAIFVATLGLCGCGEALQAVGEEAGMRAEMDEKGYATRNGRIVRVAMPEGPIIKASEYFLPGTYVLQGYDEANSPEFTDGWIMQERDSPSKRIAAQSLKVLQNRMKLDHPKGSHQAKDYPCEVYTVSHQSDGHFTAKGICRILSAGIIQEFNYQGETHQNGFIIDVVRAIRGDQASEKRIRIIAHIQSGERT